MKKGFTLIELIIVILLLSILVGVLSWILVVGLKTWGSGRNRAELRQDGVLAMESMTRDLTRASAITAAGTSNITFASDVNGDGTDETVTLALDAVNKRLNRTVGGATTILTPNIQTFTLSYCKVNTETTFTPVSQDDRDNIRIITISLILNKLDETVTLSSSVYARNQGL